MCSLTWPAFLDRHTDIAKRYMLQHDHRGIPEGDSEGTRFQAGSSETWSILGENLREFEKIVVPMPVDEYTTSKVLTMEYIRGQKVTSIVPLRRPENQGAELARRAFQGIPQANPYRRFLPCRSAPRKRIPYRRRAPGVDRPGYGGPNLRWDAKKASPAHSVHKRGQSG